MEILTKQQNKILVSKEVNVLKIRKNKFSHFKTYQQCIHNINKITNKLNKNKHLTM